MHQPVQEVNLLDLFCCEGGASMGYHQAGFTVHGVDLWPPETLYQRSKYPFPSRKEDALHTLVRLLSGETVEFTEGRKLNLADIDLIHASPLRARRTPPPSTPIRTSSTPTSSPPSGMR